ncbi:YL1 family nuclear protein [Nitzschia inconspicua]|uniref:YL1 family nuclear protein n=1 Tax=Nitzschia inconspicua TaxID=303405 RepID=A0A9K3LMJ1_9STRA|nr:YL1 family nuclear protein [Nitzschia inconspicua]
MASGATGRERRKTAGQRMNTLVGKAQEDDDAFWGHDTWNEDDSGNDSFRESDADSALAKDEFDSDFDDSETDNENEEAAAGELVEAELQKSERVSKHQRKSGAYVDNVASTTSRGVKGSGRRVMGEGFNAGLVLKFPPQMSDSLMMQRPQPQSSSIASSLVASTPFSQSSTSAEVPATQSAPMISLSKPLSNDPVLSKSKIASTRERRSTHGARKLRDSRSAPSNTKSSPTTSRKAASQQSLKSNKRKRYRQEELLMEAIHKTEPENKRWLYARKRIRDQTEVDSNAIALRDRQRGKVVQRFHSRRGCLTTLTFPEMDFVPEILTRHPKQYQEQHLYKELNSSSDAQMEDKVAEGLLQNQRSSTPLSRPVICVVTGKPAKYRDPLTKQPYFDMLAFKELRRRHEAGISIGTTTTKSVSCTTKIMPPVLGEKELAEKVTEVGSHIDEKDERKKGSPRKTTLSKKVAPMNPKLPFQSPKPPKQMAGKEVAEKLKPDQSLVQLAFSWGNGKDSESSATPVLPSEKRLSRRKWKPSENVLETVAVSLEKDEVVSIPPGLKTKPLYEDVLSIPSSQVPSIEPNNIQYPEESIHPTAECLTPCAAATAEVGSKFLEQISIKGGSRKPMKVASLLENSGFAKSSDSRLTDVVDNESAECHLHKESAIHPKDKEIKGTTDKNFAATALNPDQTSLQF